MLSYVLYVLVNFRAPDQSCSVEEQEEETGHRHEGEEWSFPCLEGAAGGDVCPAAPQLSRFGVPAGATEGADGGAAQVGCTGAGAVTELQPAGGNHGACRSWRAGEAPPQQKRPGGRSITDPGGEGYDDDDDILHGSCKIQHFLNMGSI